MFTGHAIPFHRQNTDAYCGPASVQMIVAHLRNSVAGISQATIHQTTSKGSQEDPHTPIKWASFPDRIVAALNAQSRRSPRFRLYCSPSAAELTQVVALALRQTETGAVVLFYDAKHWIVANAMSWNPGASDSDPVTIKSIYVRDPAPRIGTATGFSHATTDVCESGRDKSWPERHITIARWYQYYVTGVRRPSRWRDLHLAICAEVDLPPGLPVQVCTDNACGPACVTAAAGAGEPVRDRRERGEARISREEAMARAAAAFDQDDFEIEPLWREAREGATPAEPLLIVGPTESELDATYIVPFVSEDQERAPLLVMVDAVTGDYLESVAVPGGTTHGIGDITLRTLYELEQVVLEDTREEVRIAPLPPREELEFFWQPCNESRSPFWPFVVATTEDGRQVYVRIDGAAYAELTEAVA